MSIEEGQRVRVSSEELREIELTGRTGRVIECGDAFANPLVYVTMDEFDPERDIEGVPKVFLPDELEVLP